MVVPSDIPISSPQAQPPTNLPSPPTQPPSPAWAGGIAAPSRAPDFANVLGDTFKVYGGNWQTYTLLLLLYAMVLIVPSYFVGLRTMAINYSLTQGLQPGATPHLALSVDDVWALGLAILFQLAITILAGTLLRGAVVYVAAEGHRGRRVGPREGLRRAIERLPAAWGMYLILGAIYSGLIGLPLALLALALLLRNALLLPIAIPLLIAGAFVALFLGIALSLALPAVVVAGLAPWAGLKSSWDLTKERRGSLFAVYWVLGIIVTAASLSLLYSTGLANNPLASALASAPAMTMVVALGFIAPAVAYDLAVSYEPPSLSWRGGYEHQPALR